MKKDPHRQPKIVLTMLGYSLASLLLPDRVFWWGAITAVWGVAIYLVADWIVEKYK